MDFQLLQDPISKKWISLSPRRSKRPDETNGNVTVCPFCPGSEKENPSVYEVSEETNGKSSSGPTVSSWLIRVIPNKYPFAPIHEVIIHSQDHHKSFGELPVTQQEMVLQTYRKRYNEYKDKGQVYIFNNTGIQAGESLPHPHSQLVVLPPEVPLETLEWDISENLFLDAGMFRLGCPKVSQWPDEVWFIPKETGKTFGEASDLEIVSLADSMNRLVQIYSHRYGHEFPFNFYIRPGLDWYLRLIPRVKNLGGFELGTGVFVNTQDPQVTIDFLKEHWENPDFEKIASLHKAEYGRHV